MDLGRQEHGGKKKKKHHVLAIPYPAKATSTLCSSSPSVSPPRDSPPPSPPPPSSPPPQTFPPPPAPSASPPSPMSSTSAASPPPPPSVPTSPSSETPALTPSQGCSPSSVRQGTLLTVRKHGTPEEGTDGGDCVGGQVHWVQLSLVREGVGGTKGQAKFEEEEMGDTGLVVNWSPQMEILSDEAVGCFFTHSGWNSTIEALSVGVPMVGMPQWTDQTTDAKMVEDEWRDGVRVVVGEDGIVTREEIRSCITRVMGNEGMRRNVAKWKELAVASVSLGGSSDRNIERLVASIAGS